MLNKFAPIFALTVAIAACSPAANNGGSNDGGSNNGASNNGGSNNGGTNNGGSNNGGSNNGGTNNGAPNNGVDAGGGDGDAGMDDAGGDGGDDCISVVPGELGAEYVDDVGAEFVLPLDTEIDEKRRDLRLLFEKILGEPLTGTFQLGTGADENFGTCARCVWIRGDSPERGWFATEGTLVSATNPFSRRVDFEVTGLKLVEVAIDPLTRTSAPLRGGSCIEVKDFEGSGVFPPSTWRCDDEAFRDGASCDCECGAWDPDCGTGEACLPGDIHCIPAPTEPLPVANCMAEEVCTFNPKDQGTVCLESCNWLGGEACTMGGTCIFDFGVGDGDLCHADPDRISPDVRLGEDCPVNGYQIVCDVVDGFARGFCGPNNVCRSICESDDDCEDEAHTCRKFWKPEGLGYCGPEPMDNE